jgi:hypothetical protein
VTTLKKEVTHSVHVMTDTVLSNWQERNIRVSHTDILDIRILKVGLIDLQRRKQ